MLKERSLFIWDEAIYLNNSYEMLLNGDYLHYTINNKPNLYNTKPPLVLWLQSLSMNIFGTNSLALRLPTFLALIFLVLSTLAFTIKKFNLSVGVISALIVLTTPALITPHVFLTADLDGILVLLTTLLLLSTYHFTINQKIKSKHIYYLTAIFILGFLTKSTAIFLIIPSMLFILARNSSLIPILRRKEVFISYFAVILTIGSYYFIKESFQTGTIERVFFSEYERFYKDIMPWHTQGPFFYIQRIYEKMNPYYLIVTILLLPIFLIIKQTRFKQTVITLLGATFIYLIVISIPHAKLDWYAAPIFPIWSIVLGIIISELYNLVSNSTNKIPTWFGVILLFALLAYPTYAIIIHIKKEMAFYQPEEKEMAFLMNENLNDFPSRIKILSAFPKDTSTFFGHNHHNDVILFYQKALKNKNVNIELLYDVDNLAIGDTIIFSQEIQHQSLITTFKFDTIKSNSLATIGVLK